MTRALSIPYHPISVFCVAFHIFVTGGDRDVEVSTLVDRLTIASLDDKPFQKWGWSGSLDSLQIPKAPIISLAWLKLEVSNFVHRLYQFLFLSLN